MNAGKLGQPNRVTRLYELFLSHPLRTLSAPVIRDMLNSCAPGTDAAALRAELRKVGGDVKYKMLGRTPSGTVIGEYTMIEGRAQ